MSNSNKMLPDLPRLYWYLAILRIALVILPQLGYIHPDEYFQSIEVFAGRAFEVESNPPWEFNSSFPIRSVAIPYFTIGVLYRILIFLNYFLKDSALSLVTPYFVIVGPRLLFTLFSFIPDCCLYKICQNNNEPYKSRLIILASSYVTLVYATRTFNNTIELILFAVLLYYVSESLVFSNILTKKREYLNYRYENSRNTVEKVKFHKLKLFLTSDTFRNCIEISAVSVFGFFNRPTFLGFALFPVFFWLYRGLGNRFTAPTKYYWRILIFTLCGIPSVLFNVLVDSFFYSYLTWGEIGVLDVSINNFVFTPLNFFKYNIHTSNLAKHGLHPRFLHILVNMPLLFNLLSLFAILSNIQAIYNTVRGKHQLLPTIRSIKGLMTLSYLAPLLLLSIFPHQEPRFLIPLILPLAYLYGPQILQEPDTDLVKHDASFASKKSETKITKESQSVLFKLYLTINAILVLFYGFIHQGGVYQVANHLSRDMKVRSVNTEYHVVTSHIYSIPESLFLQKSSDKLYFARKTKYAVNKRVFLYEEGSLDLKLLMEKILDLSAKIKKQKKSKPNKNFRLLLVITSSLDDDLSYFKNSDLGLRFLEIETFYPHLSTEAFPKLGDDLLYLYSNFKFENLREISFFLHKVGTAFGLKLYEVKLDYS